MPKTMYNIENYLSIEKDIFKKRLMFHFLSGTRAWCLVNMKIDPKVFSKIESISAVESPGMKYK
ncbi:MAG: hypothetical protein J5672_03985, partial [Verrucomicrobia bacterium]|nr:hypothetical protein [Verrucomicrobiota bacterium]